MNLLIDVAIVKPGLFVLVETGGTRVRVSIENSV